MRSLLKLSVVLLWLGATAAAAQTPLWRKDVAHLPADRAALAACLAGAAPLDCERLVQTRCTDAAPPEHQSTALARRCEWRAIAAWEEELAAAVAAVSARLPEMCEGLAAAQAAWEASMIADVRLVSDPFEGGSLQGLIAARARAEAVAWRAIWVRRLAEEPQ